MPAITLPGGFTLYESRAICTYLSRKYSFPLLPAQTDLEACALFDQAQSVETQYFAEPAGKIAFEKFAKKFIGIPADEKVVSDSLKAVEAFFDVVERFLGERKYMAGNEFTLVDLYYVPLVKRLFICGFGDVFTERKNVGEWWKRVSERPAVKEVMGA